MNLENYISQLLYRYQCVTIPGFGAFLTEIQSAQHNEHTNSFYPPKKLISFNPLVKNNDGLLANHIIKTERIAYESAVNYINFEVENWNAKLEEFGQFSIKNVGDFYLNSNNKIIFEPYTQVNYLTNSFGLNSFVSPTIKRVADKKDEFSEVIEEEQDDEIIIFAPEKPINIPYLKYAAILLISGGLGAIGANYLYSNSLEKQEYVVNKKIQKQIDNKIQTATFFISNPLEKNVVNDRSKTSVVAPKMNYHVVSGVFKNQENAQKEANHLIKLGYNAKVLPVNENGSFPVVYNSYATYNEAKIAEFDIENSQNPDAWVLIQ